jgi:hypothetical protein
LFRHQIRVVLRYHRRGHWPTSRQRRPNRGSSSPTSGSRQPVASASELSPIHHVYAGGECVPV